MPRNKFDGHHGVNALGGWWITLEEATKRANGEEWWKNAGIHGFTIPVQQYDRSGPNEKPIWLFQNGDMYLGQWKMQKWPVEDGYGITYNGPIKEGFISGAGKSFWLQSSAMWQTNRLSCSKIQQDSVKVPYTYIGKYCRSIKNDWLATVTLKDGTTRVGPWKDGLPVGDCWKDHSSAATHHCDLDNSDAKPIATEQAPRYK